jgi:hypothetical protein
MTQNTHDPQNDADAPTERSHAANLLSDYCFQQGIPTNPILPSDNPPRNRVFVPYRKSCAHTQARQPSNPLSV